jgi:hypothetical protein
VKFFVPIQATGPVTGIAYASAVLGSNLQLTTSDTWYDGPSVSLSAGTWVINATAFYRRTSTTGAHVSLRIGDGTTHYASAGQYHPSAALTTFQLNTCCVITLTGTTTIKLQAATTAGAATSNIQAAVSNNGSGNNATQITAIRVA